MDPPTGYQRNISPAIADALEDTPVVFLAGPRQSGKSTLVRSLRPDAPYITFDDDAPRDAVEQDVVTFVASLGRTAILDEIQRVPQIFLALKASVDRDRVPGRFLLTGSADIMLVPHVSESLAGRVELNTLWPLSQGEIEGVREGFVDLLFGDGPLGYFEATLDRAAILARAITGGFPEAVRRTSARRRDQWFRSYVDTMTQREVRELSAIEGLDELPSLLSILATRVGSLVNVSSLTTEMAFSRTTMRRYLSLLRATYLIQYLRPWARNAGSRLVHTPKVYLSDSGLLAHLRGLSDNPGLLDDRVGPVMENFVLMELQKQITWSATRPGIWFFRSHAGAEVDFVLEARDGRVVGVEVKAAATLSARDARGINDLRGRIGERFHRGVILYTGRQLLPFGERIWAVPVEALWRMGTGPTDSA